MFMGRVSLCEREMSKRMENKEKSEKRIRKTEKERNLGLVVPGLQEMCSRYSVYDGKMVASTQSMMERW